MVFLLICEVVKYSQLESSAFKGSLGFGTGECLYILFFL